MTRFLLLLIVAIFLCGCTITPPILNVGPATKVTIADGKVFTLVAAKSGSTFLDHTIIVYIFDANGVLVGKDIVSNNGIIESLGGTTVTAMAPAISAFAGPLVK